MITEKFFTILTILAGALTTACSSQSDHNEAAEAEHEHPAGAIILSPQKAAEAGVAVEAAATQPFSGVIRVGGTVMPAVDDQRTLVAPSRGVVTMLRPLSEGSEVGAGAALVSVSASHMAEGDDASRVAVAYRAAADEYERAKALLADKLITAREFSTIETAYENARLAYRATGGSSGGATVAAPLAGYVKELLVKPGDYVEAGQPLMTLTRNRRLYLRADVPLRESASLGRVVSARFTPDGTDEVYDLDELGGRIMARGSGSTPGQPFVPVTFEFDNRSGIIPGAYAEVYLITDSGAEALTLPVEALTEEQGVNFVYIREHADCYRKQAVTLGATDGRRTVITSGVTPGDSVVTSGAIHVKLAAASNSIPAHNHNH